ncbi:MAG: 50S ribosomal protein L10, partial [Amoebophilaceae bacterium]|nr:50S ribosomal protein L10 [Amoebophilaceae bacterium]
MKRAEKLKIIEGLVERFSTFDSFYVVDAMGLTVEQVNKFRRSCFEKELLYQVAKNTLIKKALEHTGKGKQYADFFSTVLKGFSGVLFASKPANAPAKMLKEFLTKENVALPVLKGACIHGDLFIGAQHLDKLSQLKSKEEVLGDIILLLQSPMSNIMASIRSGENRLMGVI